MKTDPRIEAHRIEAHYAALRRQQAEQRVMTEYDRHCRSSFTVRAHLLAGVSRPSIALASLEVAT